MPLEKFEHASIRVVLESVHERESQAGGDHLSDVGVGGPFQVECSCFGRLWRGTGLDYAVAKAPIMRKKLLLMAVTSGFAAKVLRELMHRREQRAQTVTSKSVSTGVAQEQIWRSPDLDRSRASLRGPKKCGGVKRTTWHPTVPWTTEVMRRDQLRPNSLA